MTRRADHFAWMRSILDASHDPERLAKIRSGKIAGDDPDADYIALAEAWIQDRYR